MSETLSQRIVELLSAHSEPLTASFISFSLSDYSFDEVCEELGRLQEAGVVSLDYSGYHLRQDSEPQASEVAEPVPSNDAEEAVAETAPSGTSENHVPNEPVAAIASAALGEPEPEEPAKAVASDASEASEPEEPSKPFPVIASFLRLDQRLKDFLAAHRKKAAIDDVEKDELPATEDASAVVEVTQPVTEDASAVVEDEPLEAETAPVAVRTEPPAVEPFSADETPECMVTSEAPAPTGFEPEPAGETPASVVSSNIEALAEDVASPVIKSAPEVTVQAEEEVSPVSEPPTDEAPLTQPEETEACAPAPMEVDVDEPVPHPQRLSYEALLDELEQAKQSEGLEIFSDLPFIGAPRTSFRDERDLLYAKLSGTKDGKGLDEYPDEPTIGIPTVKSAIDEEYRKMLQEFGSEDDVDSRPNESHLPTLRSTQEIDEYHALLSRLDDASTDTRAKTDQAERPETHQPAPPEKALTFTYDMSVSAFGFSNRLSHILKARKICTVQDLIGSHDALGKVVGAGQRTLQELSDGIWRHADTFSLKLKPAQIDALCKASGSSTVVFDAFGRLCLLNDCTPNGTTGRNNVSDFPHSKQRLHTHLSNPTAPLDSFNLPPHLVRSLARINVRTIGEAARLSDDQILSLRGIGMLTVERLRDLIDELSVPGPPLSSEDGEVMSPTDLKNPEDSEEVSREASEGARMALKECQERQYPLFEESFLICMPVAALQSAGPNRTAEEYREAIVEIFEESDYLFEACQAQLAVQVERAKTLDVDAGFVDEVAVLPYPQWEKAARKLALVDGWCFYNNESHAIRIRHPHLIDWIASANFSEQTRTILRGYLSGDTLETCGRQVGLTRERVRQIVSGELKSAPAVEENRYRYFFETYRPSRKGFFDLTGEPTSTYAYLLATKVYSGSKGKLTDALKDERVPQNVRDAIRRIKDKGYVYADGFRIKANRQAIINHLAMRYASSRLITVERFRALYEQFLQETGLEDNKSFQFRNMHAFEAYVERCDQVMKLPHSTERKYGGSIRFYDTPSMDFEPLIRLLSSGMLGDIECSAAMLVEDEGFAEVLEELDIHNGYELHCVINHCRNDIKGVVVGRSPNLTFGKGDRNNQILEMIKEMSPVTAGDLAEAYSKRYGVDAATFTGSYLGAFKIYFRNGKYIYNRESFDEEQRKFVRNQLMAAGGGYLSVSLLKARFKDRFPKASTSLINDANVAELGFYSSGGLLIHNGLSEHELFSNLLDSKQRFSIEDEDFGKDVFDNMEFQAELAIRVRAYKLVEFEKGRYLSSSVFASLDQPIWPEDLRDYVDKAIAFMSPDTPYTVKSLVDAGFSHKIDLLRDDFGLSDFFFASLLATGYVGGRLKGTSLGETSVFCKTLHRYSAPVMFEQIVGKLNAIEVDDLKYLLEDTYGITITNALVRTHVKRSDLYFNETLDMVFDSEETYRRKAHEWIS